MRYQLPALFKLFYFIEIYIQFKKSAQSQCVPGSSGRNDTETLNFKWKFSFWLCFWVLHDNSIDRILILINAYRSSLQMRRMCETKRFGSVFFFLFSVDLFSIKYYLCWRTRACTLRHLIANTFIFFFWISFAIAFVTFANRSIHFSMFDFGSVDRLCEYEFAIHKFNIRKTSIFSSFNCVSFN